MLWTPRGLGAYGWTFSSTGGTRLAAAWGTTITPGNNTMGSYAQVLSGANVAKDVFGILINFNSNAVSVAARDTICDIGVDAAGGTSYTVLIPNLLATSAAPAIGASGSGLTYFFPLYIKAGSTVAVRASVNNATVGTLVTRMQVFGAPRDRRSVMVGSKVLAYGITAASSRGTTITAGTTSEGAWTSLGTIAASDNPWWWQLGMGVNDSSFGAVSCSGDLGIGDATNKATVIEDRVWGGSSAEALWDSGVTPGFYQAKAGDIVYGRLQCSGTPDSALSLAAYGVV